MQPRHRFRGLVADCVLEHEQSRHLAVEGKRNDAAAGRSESCRLRLNLSWHLDAAFGEQRGTAEQELAAVRACANTQSRELLELIRVDELEATLIRGAHQR